MNEREFWERVDGLLDERRNPLDDERVQQHLTRDPRALDEYARLSAALAAIPRRRSKRRVLAVVATAGAIAAAGLLWTNRDGSPRVASSILACQITVVRQSGSVRSTTSIHDDRRVDQRAIVDAPSESRLAHVQLTAVHHRGVSP